MKSKTYQFAAFAVCLSYCAVNALGDDTMTDLKGLEGTWEVVGIEVSGNKVIVGKGSPDKVTIKEGKITIWAQEKPFAIFKDGRLELDPTMKPKAIDIVLTKGQKVPGIYELKEEHLKLAIPKAPDNSKELLVRPESFDTKGKSVVLLVMKRSKK